MTMRHRVPFHPSYNFVSTKVQTIGGKDYGPGDEVEKNAVPLGLLRKMHDQRRIDSVVPTITLSDKQAPEETEAEGGKAKGKKSKAKPDTEELEAAEAEAEAPAKEPDEVEAEPAEKAPPVFDLNAHFGKVQILRDGVVIETVANEAKAKARIKELVSEG